MSIYLSVFLATALAGVVLIITQRWHGRFSLDSTFGIQKQHTQPTPRIGGVAIGAGMLVALQWAPASALPILLPMLIASLPAFAFGLAEDLTKRVGVLPRLLATMFSGALAWYLTGVAMQDTGFAPLDWLLQFVPLAVLFTAFAAGGVANSINIIDGFNGLASGSVAIMAAALGLIALKVGDPALASVCFLLAACSLGFIAVNWPLGKLFLGDGGAYLLGFLLAWLAILLPMRSDEISAWTTILVCAYPVIEVGFSVRRRRRRVGHHPGEPDKAHLHHFLHRRLVRPALPGLVVPLQNGLTSPLCWLGTAVPAAWAVVFAGNTPLLIVGLALAILAYGAVYARLTQFGWCFKPLTLRARPVVSTAFAKSPR